MDSPCACPTAATGQRCSIWAPPGACTSSGCAADSTRLAPPGVASASPGRPCTKHISAVALDQLPDSPRFVFCATDVTFGVNWESSKLRTGSFQAGYLDDGGTWPVGRAVSRPFRL